MVQMIIRSIDHLGGVFNMMSADCGQVKLADCYPDKDLEKSRTMLDNVGMIETNCLVTNKLNDELTRTDSDTAADHQSDFTTNSQDKLQIIVRMSGKYLG